MDQKDLQRRTTAYNAIEREGATLVYKSLTEGAYDPDTAIAVDSYNSYPGVKALYGAQSQSKTTMNAAMSVESSRKIYIAAAALPVTPKPGDVVTMDGEDWNVLPVNTTWSHGVAVLYDMDCTK